MSKIQKISVPHLLLWLLVFVLLLHSAGLFFLPSVSFGTLVSVGALICLGLFLWGKLDSKSLIVENDWDNKFLDMAILVAFLLVGLVLRLWNVGGLELGTDASYHFEAASDFLSGRWPDYSRAWLYSLSIAFVWLVFGRDSSIPLILPGLLISLSTIGVLFFIAKKWFNRPVAYLATFLLVISPWQIAQAQTIRMYDFSQFFSLLSIYFVFQFVFRNGNDYQLRKSDLKYVLFAAVCSILSWHAQPIFLGIGPSLLIYFLLCSGLLFKRKYNLKQLLTNKITIVLLLLFGGLVVVFINFLDFLGFYWGGYVDYRFHFVATTTFNFLDWFSRQYGFMWMSFLLSVCLAFVLYLLIKRYHHPWLKSLVLLQCIFYGQLIQYMLVYKFIGVALQPRHMFFVNPVFILLIATGIYVTIQFGIRSNKKLIALVVVMALVGIRVWINYNLETSQYIGDTSKLFPYDTRFPVNSMIKELNNNEDISERALMATHPGFWLSYQDQSENIISLSPYNYKSYVFTKEEMLATFFDTIKNNRSGYYLTDSYRQHNWPCDVFEQLPCVIRGFIDDFFVEQEQYNYPPSLLYKWLVVKPFWNDYFSTTNTRESKWLRIGYDSIGVLQIKAKANLLNEYGDKKSLLLTVSGDEGKGIILLPVDSDIKTKVGYYYLGLVGNLKEINIVDENTGDFINIWSK